MKAVKAKYENGGEIMYSDEEDGGKTHRSRARAALKKQIDEMAIERDRMMRGTVKGGTMYAEANPDMEGVTNLAPKSQASVKNFYDKKIAKFEKELEKYREPKEKKVKMWDRKDTMDLVKGMTPLAAQTKDSNIRRG
tara:strand:- start:227 stop:637 length:411 start_codon:yes stop_codon:yes gene_type:complete